MKHLELSEGGKLIQFKHNKETGEYDETDVTSIAPTLLWTEVRVNDSTTLNDVFLLLDNHIDFFDMVIGNWCKDFVNEALNNESEEDSDLAEARLSWNFTVNDHYKDGKDEFSGHQFPNFGAVGKDGTKYGIELTPTFKYKHLPLVLSQEAEIFNEGEFYKKKDYKNPQKYMQTISHVSYTLGDILYGIIWEISFFGNPQSRQKQSDELNSRIDSIDMEDTIPMEEVMEQLRNNAKDME